jgi:hypothetical protein
MDFFTHTRHLEKDSKKMSCFALFVNKKHCFENNKRHHVSLNIFQSSSSLQGFPLENNSPKRLLLWSNKPYMVRNI